MARWFEGSEEAAFKPVAGGYVFQAPSLAWPFGRASAYLVNEQQKAALTACLRRQRWQVLLVTMGIMLAYAALGVTIAMSHQALHLSAAKFAVVIIVVAMTVFGMALLPYFWVLRAMRPLLVGLPPTDQRITAGEQIQRLATAISPKVLWLGGAGGVLMIVGNLMTVVDPLSESPRPPGFPSQVFGMLVGAALTGYFVYLAILRRKSRRS